MDYLVKKITIKDDYVKIVLETPITISNFLIRTNDYLDLNLRLNSNIAEEMVDKLTSLHQLCFAYKKCLNKLTNKDYSVKEIEELLIGLNIENYQQLITEFILSGLLNDENLVKNYFEIGQMKKIGKGKLYQDLKQRKISETLIQKYYELVDDKIEIENGLFLTNKYYETFRDTSHNEKIKKIKLKLVNNGYQDNLSEIIRQSTLKKDEENEYNNLLKAYQKAQRLYEKKYKKASLRQHVFNYLYSKGYQSTLINKVIEGEENEDY